MPLYCRSKSIPIAVLCEERAPIRPTGWPTTQSLIDLMRMTAVRVDPEKKLAFVQAGADGGDVDHETALHNLICISGSVSHTGFAGVALGGGLGHLSRWLRPVVDNIVGYEMGHHSGKGRPRGRGQRPGAFLGHARERSQLRVGGQVRQADVGEVRKAALPRLLILILPLHWPLLRTRGSMPA